MIPTFATRGRFSRGEPDFAWDEWDIEPYYDDYDPAQLARLSGLYGNANHAFVCACGYWIAERFSALDPSRESEGFLDVASASTYDAPQYEYFEIDEEDWHGPVRGAQALMITIAVDALYCLMEDPEPAIRVCYMYNLCRHLLAPDDDFVAWFEQATERLERYYLRPIAPLAARAAPTDFGPRVPMSAFELDLPYTPVLGEQVFRRNIEALDPSNPFFPEF